MIAAIYARKSTDQTGVADHEKSVTRQIDHATACAVGKGWTVAAEHICSDDGISGAEFAKRPGFLRLLNALTPRAPFDVLLVSGLSRLGREQLETGFALKQLSQAGVIVYSCLESREIPLDTATDKFLMSAVSFAAEIEREKARQRTYDAMRRKALAGHVTGGRVFGNDNVRRESGEVVREINEEEAAILRRIFKLCAEGHGQKAHLARLTDEREGARVQSARQINSPRARRKLLALARTWRQVLAKVPLHARPILSKLLVGRVTFTPLAEPKRWELRGRGTLSGLFDAVLPLGMASPTGLLLTR